MFIMNAVQGKFTFGKVETDNFRFCGKRVRRTSHGDILVDCAETLQRIGPVRMAPGRRKQAGDACSETEQTQLRSIVGSMTWVARQARPDMAYAVSRLQSRQGKALVRDLLEANKTLKKAQENEDVSVTFKSGLVNFEEAIIVNVTDASHAAEEVYVGERVEPYRSQSGRLALLADPKILEEGNQSAGVYVVEWTSTTIKRVCRSTLQAESYSLTGGVEAASHIRAFLYEIMKPLPRVGWEPLVAADRLVVWVSDCRSLCDALTKPVVGKISDKRLAIEISALRQDLWRRRGEGVGVPQMCEQLPEDATDVIRWVDTVVMIADPLTKFMEADALREVLTTCRWSLVQPAEAVEAKKARAGQRQAAKMRRQGATAVEVKAWQDADAAADVDEGQ